MYMAYVHVKDRNGDDLRIRLGLCSSESIAKKTIKDFVERWRNLEFIKGEISEYRVV